MGLHLTGSSVTGLSNAFARVSAKSAGVKADGTTDDEPVLTALCASVGAAGGGHIVLPEGTIRVDHPIVLKNNVTISGAGQGRTVIRTNSVTQAAFWALEGTALAPTTGVHLRDFSIDGTDVPGTTYSTGAKGIFGQFLSECSFRDLTISNTPATGLGIDFLHKVLIQGVTVKNTGRLNNGTTDPGGNGIGIGVGGMTGLKESFVVHACRAEGVKNGGIMVEGQGSPSRGTRVTSCYAATCGTGFLDAGTWGGIWEGNYAESNVGDGFAVRMGTNGTASRLGRRGQMVNNFAYINGGAGFYYDATSSLTTSPGYRFSGNIAESNTTYGIALETVTNDLDSFLVTDNWLYKNTKSNLYLHSTSTGKIKNSVLSRNLLHFAGSSGSTNDNNLRVDIDTLDTTIEANECNGQSLTVTNVRFWTGRTHTNLLCRDNRAVGGSTTVWQENGTYTNCRFNNNLGYVNTGVAAISVTASPFTYTAGKTPETVYVDGGTVSSVVKSSVTLRTSTGGMFRLEPNDSIVVTYSSAPTMTKDRF